jgi:hypothetical protein
MLTRYQDHMRAALAGRHVPAPVSQTILGSLGGALAVAKSVGGATGALLAQAARAAFMSGTEVSLAVGAIVAIGGAVLVLAALPLRTWAPPRRGGVPASQPPNTPSLDHPLGRNWGCCGREVAPGGASWKWPSWTEATAGGRSGGPSKPKWPRYLAADGPRGRRRVTCRWVAMPGSRGGRPGSPSNQYQQYDLPAVSAPSSAGGADRRRTSFNPNGGDDYSIGEWIR